MVKETRKLVDWVMGESERKYEDARAVPMSEMGGCPTHRLDPHHYLPVHRTWEHFTKSPTPSRAQVIAAYRSGKLPEDEFRKAAEVI